MTNRSDGVAQTTEYGVSFTLERDSKYQWAGRRLQYWTPGPSSEREAIQATKREYDHEIEEVHCVETREVPEPEGCKNAA